MAYRQKMKRSRSRKLFRKTAMKRHKRNDPSGLARGGIRL